MDVQKQIDYWRSGSVEDMEVAGILLDKDRVRHALFFAELAVEKVLKAHVAKVTCGIPPRTHDLLRLADLAKLSLSPQRRDSFAGFQQYCLAGRYPDHQPPAISHEAAELEIAKAREIQKWLMSLL